jgi:hypothetical protein
MGRNDVEEEDGEESHVDYDDEEKEEN